MFGFAMLISASAMLAPPCDGYVEPSAQPLDPCTPAGECCDICDGQYQYRWQQCLDTYKSVYCACDSEECRKDALEDYYACIESADFDYMICQSGCLERPVDGALAVIAWIDETYFPPLAAE